MRACLSTGTRSLLLTILRQMVHQMRILIGAGATEGQQCPAGLQRLVEMRRRSRRANAHHESPGKRGEELHPAAIEVVRDKHYG